jgi:hypothetical protein
MEGLIIWIKKNKFIFGLMVLLFFLVPLILVHVVFKFNSNIEWLTAEWSAGDVLSYIAGFEAFIGTVTLGGLAILQNQQIHKRNIVSLAPAISMNLISLNGFLYLTIENTGQNEAKEINISVDSIQNNGENYKLMLDDLFSTTFELYPKETVQGCVAISGANIKTQIFPQITVAVSYLWPQLNRREQYKRQVIFDYGYSKKLSADISIDNRNMESDVDKIARAVVRVANYLDGCQVAKFDELNILAGRSLRNDMVEALKTKEKVPVLNRTETINECLGVSDDLEQSI